MAGHSWTNKQKVVRCGYPLKDDSPCQAGARLNGRCEHHAAVEIGHEFGWGVSGSRKAEAFVAARGDQRLFASSAREMFELLAARHGRPKAKAA